MILPTLSVCGLGEPFWIPAAFFNHVRRRRRLHNKRERLIRKCGDYNRDRHSWLNALGLRVKRFAEFHDVETALTQRRANRGGMGLLYQPALAA